MQRTRRIVLTVFLVGILGALGAESAFAQKLWRGVNVSASLTEQDLTDLDRYSVNVVRFQLNASSFADTASKAEYMAWLGGRLDNLDALIPLFKRYKIGVVIDLHTPPGGFLPFTSAKPQFRMFAEPWAQAAFLEAWELISARYKGNSVIVAYEPLSEPAVGSAVAPGLLSWGKLLPEVGKVIRANDKKHPIVVNAAYADPTRLSTIKWPRTLGKPIYSLNFYRPTKFLYQGVDRPVNSASYPTAGFGKKQLVAGLKRATDFSRKTKARIMVSEFSTSRYGTPGSGARYLKDLIGIFEANGWNWTYHAWREAPIWSFEYGADGAVSAKRTDRAVVLQSFWKRNR